MILGYLRHLHTQTNHDRYHEPTQHCYCQDTDIWETAGEGTIFGFNKDELREKLVTDPQFRARFDEHFDMMTTMMKEIKADEKAKIKASKDKKEREKLVATLSVIEDRDNYSLKGWEGWNWSETLRSRSGSRTTRTTSRRQRPKRRPK